MNSIIHHGPVTIVMGDLTGWHPRLVYRSTAPIQVTIDPTGAFARLAIRGQQQVGAIVTPTGQTEPVIYLGSFLPPQPLAARHGWEPADMPAGVTCEPVEADVLVVSATTDTDDPVGYASTLWLPRTYRPMERLQLRLTSAFDPAVTVDARVLEVTAIRFQDNPVGTPSIVVAVDDLQPAANAGWEPQTWVNLRRREWLQLDALSRCLQTHAHALMNTAVTAHVDVLDLASLNAQSLGLLPVDVRDALERSLLALPD